MSQPKIEIVDTDDEEGVEIEIVDTDEETPEIEEKEEDYDDLLSYDTLSVQESSTSSLTEELKKLGDDIFKGEKYRKYEEAIKGDIPPTFIAIVNNEVVNMKKLFMKSKDITTNYNFFINKGIKIQPQDFVLLFYIANKDKSKKYLIENFNMISDLTGVEEYYIEAFEDYKSNFENIIKFRMDKVKGDIKSLKQFYSKIESFKTTDKYSDILETFSEDIKKSIFSVKDDGYLFDQENTRIIFNNIEANSFFSYIRLDDDNGTLYKIYTGGNKKYENFIDYNYNIPYEKNKLYLFYELTIRNKRLVNHIKFDFNTSKCEINYYGNTIQDILSRTKELLPNIVITNKQDTELSGDFEITIDNFDETKLYYLTLFDEVFQQFIYIREDSSVRSMKENIKYYFVGSDQVREYLNYSSFFYIKQLYNNRYLIKYTSKSTSTRMIKEFILILSKLFWYYNNLPEETLTYLKIISTPYNGVEGGLGGNDEDRNDLTVSIKTRKIENLQKIDEELFQKRIYVRTCPCQKQPITIAKEDVGDWENYELDGKKRNVVLFPPEKSKQKVSKNYYVCPDDKFTNFSLRENPDSSSLYPLIPCCNISNFTQELYDDYDLIRENPSKYWSEKEEHKGKSTGILKTLKILRPGRKGIVTDYITNFLSKIEKDNYIREGARSKSSSSFLHCLFKGVRDYKVENIQDETFKKIRTFIEKYNQQEAPEKKESAITKFRKLIGSFQSVSLEVSMQELYDHSIQEILQLLINPNINIESNKFYRFFEIFLMINIFVFVFDRENNTTYLEVPSHQYYHIRIVNDKLPCLFLIKHKRKYSFDVYEIVRREDKKDPFIFSSKFSKYMKQYIFDNNMYYIRKNNVLRKNCFNVLDWDVILKDYQIKHQSINSSGRMFSFSFVASTNPKDLITVFTESSPPLFCPSSDDIYFTTKKRCIKFFGNNFKSGNNGLWYPVNDIEEGFFIPCSDVGKNEELICKDFEIILGKDKKNRELENIEVCKFNSNIYLQLMRWLYLKENMDLEKWFGKNIKEDPGMNPEYLVAQKFNIPLRFPLEIKTTKEGICYLSKYIPEIFDKKSAKIYLYPQLYHSTKRNLTNFIKANQDLVIPNRKTLSNVLVYEKDFKKYSFNKILIGGDFNYWENNIVKEKQEITDIDEEYVNYKIPFIFKNNKSGKIYIIQNTEDNLLTVSLVICKVYQLFKDGGKYEINLKNIWSLIKAYYPKYNFGWTFDKLKDFINSKTERQIYFKNETECLDFLIKNKISFQLEDKFSYIVYSKVNDKINVSRKYIIDDQVPLEIYSFSSGAYASMLPII